MMACLFQVVGNGTSLYCIYLDTYIVSSSVDVNFPSGERKRFDKPKFCK